MASFNLRLFVSTGKNWFMYIGIKWQQVVNVES